MKILQIFLVFMILYIHGAGYAQTETPDSMHETNDTIYHPIEPPANFPGGETALFKWLAKNIRYPEAAVDSGYSGTVFVQFVVETDGRLTSFEVRKGVHPILDSAAVADLSKMPNWIPSKINGKAVPSKFIIPLQYLLPDKPAKGRKKKSERRWRRG